MGIVSSGVSSNISDKGEAQLSDVRVIEPDVHRDGRGWFSETFSQQAFESLVGPVRFVQDNHSSSRLGVLRGLHYQLAPRSQGKLIRVVRGAVFDVGVDLRRSSPTFGRWVGLELTSENMKQVWLPPGYAHGFLALTDPADVVYKVTDYYSPEHERAVRWDDPEIGIEWPGLSQPSLSERDSAAPFLREADVFE